MLDWIVFAGVVLLVGRAYGWRITMVNEKDKIIYHPPPPGSSPMSGAFEVPLNSAGEDFIKEIMKNDAKPTVEAKNDKNDSSYL